MSYLYVNLDIELSYDELIDKENLNNKIKTLRENDDNVEKIFRYIRGLSRGNIGGLSISNILNINVIEQELLDVSIDVYSLTSRKVNSTVGDENLEGFLKVLRRGSDFNV